MSISLIRSVLTARLAREIGIESWLADEEARAEKVRLFRAYVDGDHRANLTNEMRRLLRITGSGGSMNEFNDNYMDIIVQTEADRLEVTAVEAESGAGEAQDAALNEWVANLLAHNRFDGMQGAMHEGAIRDGDTYALVDFDMARGGARITHEPAYDGTRGMLVVHGDDGYPAIAIKIWRTTQESIADTMRINVYYPDRIEKYIAPGMGSVERYIVEGEDWPALWPRVNGELMGVPVRHLPNRPKSYSERGISEIENAIPLQDMLNRTLYSMVMTAELTAFQIKYAAGFTPPAGITPGMWITIGGDGLTKDDVWEVGALEQGSIVPFIEQAKWLTSEMGKITRTPSPEFMGGDSASGEALKQREISLLGKVKRFQISGGNFWEDVIALAHRVETAYGKALPPYARFNCKWTNAEIRNDTAVVESAVKAAPYMGQRETLRQLAPVYGWDGTDIDRIMQEKQEDAAASLSGVVGDASDFSNIDAFFGGAGNNA